MSMPRPVVRRSAAPPLPQLPADSTVQPSAVYLFCRDCSEVYDVEHPNVGDAASPTSVCYSCYMRREEKALPRSDSRGRHLREPLERSYAQGLSPPQRARSYSRYSGFDDDRPRNTVRPWNDHREPADKSDSEAGEGECCRNDDRAHLRERYLYDGTDNLIESDEPYRRQFERDPYMHERTGARIDGLERRETDDSKICQPRHAYVSSAAATSYNYATDKEAYMSNDGAASTVLPNRGARETRIQHIDQEHRLDQQASSSIQTASDYYPNVQRPRSQSLLQSAERRALQRGSNVNSRQTHAASDSVAAFFSGLGSVFTEPPALRMSSRVEPRFGSPTERPASKPDRGNARDLRRHVGKGGSTSTDGPIDRTIAGSGRTSSYATTTYSSAGGSRSTSRHNGRPKSPEAKSKEHSASPPYGHYTHTAQDAVQDPPEPQQTVLRRSQANEPRIHTQELAYQRLDFARFETRLIDILGGDGRIRCRLYHASLLDPLSYVALSYCWGDPEVTDVIEVNGVPFAARTNLVAALRELRRKGVRTVWIDALCINQSDLYEKSQQIQRMGQIYASANKVVAWLGSASHGSSAAIAHLDQSVNVQPAWDHSLRKDVRQLFERPYFSRVWIIQEIVKAKEVELWCGTDVVAVDAIDTYLQRTTAPQPGIEQRLNDLLSAIQQFRVRETQSRIGQPRMLLVEALVMSRHTFATDARDKMYAILGLTLDGTDVIPRPDYVRDPRQVFLEATVGMVATEGFNMVMLLARGKSTSIDVKSWLPDWTALPEPLPPWIVGTMPFERETLDFSSTFVEGVLTVTGRLVESVLPDRYRLFNMGELSPKRVLKRVWDALMICSAWEDFDTNSTPSRFYYSTGRKAHAIATVFKQDFARPRLSQPPSAKASTNLRHRQLDGHLPIASRTGTDGTIEGCLHYVRGVTYECSTIDEWVNSYWSMASFNRAYRNRAKRSENQSTIGELKDAIQVMARFDMKLAISSLGQFRMVHKNTRARDEIYRLQNCGLPVVLRQMVDGRYQLVGEMCALPTQYTDNLGYHFKEPDPYFDRDLRIRKRGWRRLELI